MASTELVDYDLAAYVPQNVRSSFENCILRTYPTNLDKIEFKVVPTKGRRYDSKIVVSHQKLRGRIQIWHGPGSADIHIATAGPVNLDIRTWRVASLHIAEGTTVNQARIVCDHSDVTVGRDGLWSDEILIQSNDQHGIIDLNDGTLLNGHRRRIHIGEHVWIGRRATILPDLNIGSGSIIAANAVLASNTPPQTLFGGVPAKIIRDKVTWSRGTHGFSDAERRSYGSPLG